MLSRTFKLPCYVAGFDNLLAEALSPPPIHTRFFNKLIEVFLNIEAEEGKDSDSHASLSC